MTHLVVLNIYLLKQINNLPQPLAPSISSSNGLTQAEKEINTSSKNLSWLVQFEMKLNNLQCHPNFRIFLSMQITPKIPSYLI